MEGRSREGQSFLLENFKNFRWSKGPSRIMYFGSDGEWKDFPSEQFQSLGSSFTRGRSTVEVPMDGKPSVVEFLRMTQTDLVTGDARSVAWIDVDGRCFFPRRIVGCNGPEVRMKCRGRDGRTRPDQSVEERSDASSGMSCESPRWESAVAVSCGEYYRVVERAFLAGMRKVDPRVVVSSIRRCGLSSPIWDARTWGFRAKAVRGNANLTFGWFGTSKDRMDRILQHGFGQPDDDAYGNGVRLARPEFVHTICKYSVADESGERHVLLCRVIAGSIQCQPSSERYDSGVDDVLSPWWCIASTHMNTHVIPECIVSFRLSGHLQGGTGLRSRETAVPAKKPSFETNTSFSQVLSEIEKSLPPSAMRTLDLLFDRYKAKKIQKDIFIRQLRGIAGNKLLLHTINKIRNRI